MATYTTCIWQPGRTNHRWTNRVGFEEGFGSSSSGYRAVDPRKVRVHGFGSMGYYSYNIDSLLYQQELPGISVLAVRNRSYSTRRSMTTAV